MYALCSGKSETDVKVLRSILAQLEFSWLVRDYDDRLGVPFRHRLYVPEIHPITKEPFCEREDEAHVLKVGYSTTVKESFCVYTSCMETEKCTHTS